MLTILLQCQLNKSIVSDDSDSVVFNFALPPCLIGGEDGAVSHNDTPVESVGNEVSSANNSNTNTTNNQNEDGSISCNLSTLTSLTSSANSPATCTPTTTPLYPSNYIDTLSRFPFYNTYHSHSSVPFSHNTPTSSTTFNPTFVSQTSTDFPQRSLAYNPNCSGANSSLTMFGWNNNAGLMIPSGNLAQPNPMIRFPSPNHNSNSSPFNTFASLSGSGAGTSSLFMPCTPVRSFSSLDTVSESNNQSTLDSISNCKIKDSLKVKKELLEDNDQLKITENSFYEINGRSSLEDNCSKRLSPEHNDNSAYSPEGKKYKAFVEKDLIKVEIDDWNDSFESRQNKTYSCPLKSIQNPANVYKSGDLSVFLVSESDSVLNPFEQPQSMETLNTSTSIGPFTSKANSSKVSCYQAHSFPYNSPYLPSHSTSVPYCNPDHLVATPSEMLANALGAHSTIADTSNSSSIANFDLAETPTVHTTNRFANW